MGPALRKGAYGTVHRAVRLRDASALATIPLKGGDEGIPTLEDILDLVAGRVPLLVEFKDQDGAMGPDVGALVQISRSYEFEDLIM